MHGVRWSDVREQYEAMLEDCASREDVSYVIREMISELNVGHTYYWGGDVERAPQVSVGMPGCWFELANGAYRIREMMEGGPWDVDGRGPLSQPGVDVEEGDYLLAVNGVPVDPAKDPWAAFQGLHDQTVTLTVSKVPEIDDQARHVVVKLDQSEYMLRYRAWVEKNRRYVEQQTNGRVGYIYVPNTSIWGQNELIRQFVGQRTKQALIVDERWNGGGQIPTRFIELLNRPIVNYWALRDRDEPFPWPPDAHHGPKCMLINGLAGSGGDYFPFWFRESGCGKLIGTRTWGGLVGISGNPRLVDGGYTSAPTFAFFETDGTWGIEGHGVDPDIEVVDDPSLMVDGKDPQLDAAIEHMLEEIKRNPYVVPKVPRRPDRSGMGIREKDK
jgi:tricorn protease